VKDAQQLVVRIGQVLPLGDARQAHEMLEGPGTAVRGHHRCFDVSCRLAVSEARLALPNFYNVTIRIANVAERLAVLFLWLCDKLGSSISP
jgi:hypothetical protein